MSDAIVISSDLGRDLSAGSGAERREPKGPPFWEDWRGELPDNEIELVRVVFEEFCAAWE